MRLWCTDIIAGNTPLKKATVFLRVFKNMHKFFRQKKSELKDFLISSEFCLYFRILVAKKTVFCGFGR
jgi:hypothetical protein